MRIAGVIVEYNPFHNGHLYHLQKTKKQTEADLVIAVMSGNFLQRGEPALLSKWTRTRLALQAGADLVVELPYVYATQKADVFAWGAVSILDLLGTTDLCFGSENGSTTPFLRTLEVLEENRDFFNQQLKKRIASGISYPQALNLAFSDLHLTGDDFIDLSQPNNILGFHYVEAVVKRKSAIRVSTIKRQKAGYNQATISDAHIASATAIRRAIFSGEDFNHLQNLVPPYTYEALTQARQNRTLRRWDDFFPLLKYRILTTSADEIAEFYEAEEGLENRLKKHIRQAKNFSNWMERIKTKRYTWTRLQRLCTHILTGAKKAEMRPAAQFAPPTYIRLLGMNEYGQLHLNSIKKRLNVPIISKVGRNEEALMAIDLRAADCYRLIQPASDPSEFDCVPIRFDHASKTFVR